MLQEKIDKLKQAILDKESLVVAFSGGVDSGFLLLVAKEALGENVTAVFVDTETVSENEREFTTKAAEKLGVELKVIEYSVLDIPGVASNGPDRCYHCRRSMAIALNDLAGELDIPVIATGTNVEDLDDYRPGIKAEKEQNIWHPLSEIGFGKEEIRTYMKEKGVEWWDKPASPCLSSRINFGDPITKDSLERIDKGEALLRDMSFRIFRVRSQGDTARIEISEDEMPRFLEKKDEWPTLISQLKDIGFKHVSFNLEPFKSGSMNRVLDPE